MFGFIPALKLRDGALEIDAFDTRKDGDQHNFDILRVTTVDEDDNRLTTQFGIQGQSDHLAEELRKRRDKKSSKKSSKKTEDKVVDLKADPAAA